MTIPNSNLPVRRGEIWLVEFDPARGAEIQKTRPALVVSVASVGKLPLKIVVPITDWKPVFAQAVWFVHLMPDGQNGLSKESGTDAFQIKSLSEERFVRKLGEVTGDQLVDVAKTIALCVGFVSLES